MKIYSFISILIFLLIFSQNSFSQHFLSANGKAIINETGDTIVLRGMGLGGWMLQEGYMLQTSGFANAQYEIRQKIEDLIGLEDTQQFYDNWLENYMQKSDIDSLKSWGFNSVRLPMHYNLFTLPIEDEPVPNQNTWLEKGFELTDSLIEWCRQNEMYVILDLHAAPGGQGQEGSISDYDPTKPGLWQSEENKKKTVALWKRLAEKYADEQWIAGYDLLNEVNWNLPEGIALRELYEEITDSIRTVDNRHIIFIEGNWFANDFTGLTPPWDDNLVYSPHKYWSFNEQADIQWVIDIRDQFNVPIYFGESGENSNTWFRDAISLLESEGMGWAWWPHKKVESISGPLAINKSEEYQSLLDYWNGNGQMPSQEFARDALMQLAEDLKIENCKYQKDVIDAMFRQVRSDDVIPFRTQQIPGIVYTTDFDMGPVGSAYYDTDIANYNVSTGNFTAWNQGWSYRNDGVDIQVCEDTLQSNGYNVGWTATGEWIQYDVDVEETALYDIEIRYATEQDENIIHFESDGADLTQNIVLNSSGGWQVWQTALFEDVILSEENDKLLLYIDKVGANLSYFNFIKKGETTSVGAKYISAITLDEKTIELHLNKPMDEQSINGTAGFSVHVDNELIEIGNVRLSQKNPRIIEIGIEGQFESNNTIKVSYNNNEVLAQDMTALDEFTQENVENTIIFYHAIPGRIEAEDYYFQSGIQLEMTTDEGGGQNIGFLDSGDFLDYFVDVSTTALYKVTFRTAAQSETGGVQLQIIDENGDATALQSIVFQPTGDWQSWRSTSQQVSLEKGIYQFRIFITKSQFNMNWFEFSILTSIGDQKFDPDFKIYPNPSNNGIFQLEGLFPGQNITSIEVYNSNSYKIYSEKKLFTNEMMAEVNLNSNPAGIYFLVIRNDKGQAFVQKLIYVKD